MVTTRAGAARAARTGSGSSSNPSQDQPLQSVEVPASTSPTPSLVISTNNLHYNVSTFDSDLRRRVKKGLEDNEIKMKYCTSPTQATDGIKHFHIDDDISVAIGGQLDRPKCTCGANEGGLACKVRRTISVDKHLLIVTSTYIGLPTRSCRQLRNLLIRSLSSFRRMARLFKILLQWIS